MVESLTLAAALLCCALGMAWLALAMKSHWQQVLGDRPLTKNAQFGLRLLGASSITTSLLLCVLADHPTMAILVWVMALAISAVLVAFALSWKPALLLPLVAWKNTKSGNHSG
jgi:hypothetical protein